MRKILLLAAILFSTNAKADSIVLAGGCFWGVEAVFEHTKGVTDAVSGYAGGSANTAQYYVVGEGNTGHAESVQVTYDPSIVSLSQLLDIYFNVAHNPTELNRQGPDYGTQYRSAVFYADPEQKKSAEEKIAELTDKKFFSNNIVTTIEPLKAFYPAEDYHQNYMLLHPDEPYIVVNDAPKVVKLKEKYPALYR